MGEHVKNQHYVPQFLLKNFSSRSDKFIWVYDKNQKHRDPISEKALKNLASEDFFYDKIKGSKDESFEYPLQKIENITAPIIANIVKTKRIETLSNEDRKSIALFTTLQLLRTKGQLFRMDSWMNHLHNQIKQKAGLEFERTETKKIWFSMLEESSSIYKILMNKVWMLCISDKNFFIADHPVTLQNTSSKREARGNLGLDSYGIEIYLPLSPSVTLCLFCEKLFQNNGYYMDYLDTIMCTPENIENLNWLQITNAQRFVFSHTNEFKGLNTI